MLNGIDTSNWQGSYDVAATGSDFVIVKATEGTNFVDPYCDNIVQQAISSDMPWGFYHFAGDNAAIEEATFFIQNTLSYFGHGIPVLDWEGNQSVDWVNSFVEHVHDKTGVWPWIYANPWRFNQGGVNSNCARWVASYPDVTSPTWEQAQGWERPSADGNVVAWQFCSDGQVNGINGNVDMNLFYGDAKAWAAYAAASDAPEPTPDTSEPCKSDLGEVHVRYALHTNGGDWLPEVVDDTDYAGNPFGHHDMLLMYVDKGSIRYRAHGVDGYWRDWVTGADYNDDQQGMAGSWGVDIDAVQAEYLTPDGYKYKYAYYESQTVCRDGWLPTVRDCDDYAGNFNEAMDRFRIRIGD